MWQPFLRRPNISFDGGSQGHKASPTYSAVILTLDVAQTTLREKKKKDKKCRKLSFTRFCLKVTDFAAGTNISGFIAAQLFAEFG